MFSKLAIKSFSRHDQDNYAITSQLVFINQIYLFIKCESVMMCFKNHTST